MIVIAAIEIYSESCVTLHESKSAMGDYFFEKQGPLG